MTWSVRLTRRGRTDYDETSMAPELAQQTFDRLCETIRDTGGTVELLRGGEAVASITVTEGRDGK
jgi:hypothetical protein